MGKRSQMLFQPCLQRSLHNRFGKNSRVENNSAFYHIHNKGLFR
jgi:hypothetical protein